MQEAAYATLTSQLHAYFETGKAPPRTGNASHGRVQAGLLRLGFPATAPQLPS
jgi:hypothetical protein